MHTLIVGPQLKQKIGVCQNEHRPRFGVQKYVTAIHRRKLVKHCEGGAVLDRGAEGVDGSGVQGGVSPSPVGWGLGPQNFLRFSGFLSVFIVWIFRGDKNYGQGGRGPWMLWGPCACAPHNLCSLLLRQWVATPFHYNWIWLSLREIESRFTSRRCISTRSRFPSVCSTSVSK